MKRILSLILAAVLILPIAASCGQSEPTPTSEPVQKSVPEAEKYSFKYQSSYGDYTAYMYYDDSFLMGSAREYSKSLATASLSLSMASFNSLEEKDYEKKSRNAVDLLKKLGYKNIDTNEFFKEKPGADTLGCVFGVKEIDGVKTIACGVRGANYESEWASNFTIGNEVPGNYHKGFFEGSEILLESLKKYISDNKISGEIRLWMVGYSRAGAVCNISAGIIDEWIENGENILGQDIKLTRDKFFVYCFEAPQGVCFEDSESSYPKSEKFDNIFCIVNPNDVVPKVAMRELSFTRYGVEKVLFDNRNDKNYSSDIEKVKYFFDGLENSVSLGKYIISDFEMKTLSGLEITASDSYCNWTQGIFLDDFIDSITRWGIKDRENYVQKIEEGIREIFKGIYASGSISMSDLSNALDTLKSDYADFDFNELLSDVSKLEKEIKTAILKVLKSFNVDVDNESVVSAVEEIMRAAVRAFLHDFDISMFLSLASETNILAVVQAHRPEMTLAYMRSMDPLYTDDPVDFSMDGRYYCVESSTAGADFRVYCGDTEIVQFEDGAPKDVGSSVPYGNCRGLKIYLPYGEKYRIESSTGKVSVSICDPSRLETRSVGYIAERIETGYRMSFGAVS